ncbi:Imm26 family immunity protein [Metabacillus fastidiosus]|uniref:Imm26 family immunity protein n=1 Tax=Metabacillus fastidiosus TaxID=1458 RepID=UPI003D26ECF9
MDINQYLDKLNFSLKVGKVDILLSNYGDKEFTIFENLANLFRLDTNFDAEVYLKGKIRDKGIKGKIIFDSESDYVSISSKKGETILKVATLINELSNNMLDEELLLYFEKFIMNWKTPKKQKWGKGDIFSIPLTDGSYYFAQVIDLIEDITPVIVIFNVNTDKVPTEETLKKANPLTVLSLIPDKLDNFLFRVVKNMTPLFNIPSKIRRDPIRNIQYSSQTIIEYCEAIKTKNQLDSFAEFNSNVTYLNN